ncbi:serine/threonine protein phosphatase [Puniceicoccaceae bacterium K14]|nr:serine/threonine protein phosphatase [Puniceicoccaceae bacterium K14]
MINLKDTQRANVSVGFDGLVRKRYSGPSCAQRFANEVRVLTHLNELGCPFTPKLVDVDKDSLEVVMTHCGCEAPMVSEEKANALFEELKNGFGVEHGDPFSRNITYNTRTGDFNIIDFEYAMILDTGVGFTIEKENLHRKLFAGEN